MAGVDMDINKMIASLQGKSLKGRKVMAVRVGYTAPYAVYVHEDMMANHPNGGQAKYLSTPAASKRIQRQMRDAIARSVKAKNGLEEGVMRAGQILLAASRPLVPVDTGELRDSGFVKVE